MKRIAAILFSMSLGLAALPAAAQRDVNVSIGINQPGLYGRIDIGNAPPPPVVYAQPVIYAPTPVAVHQRPIYLYVPADHQRHWGRYCGRYAACGQPVYFVQERWVHEHARPRRGWERDGHPGHGHGHGRGHGKHGRD